MPKATVSQTHAGRCRVHINFGGRGPWCSFDYVVEPDHSLSALDIGLGECVDDETVKWFPFVKDGIEKGLLALRQQYDIELSSLRIRIDHVYSHPVDTTAEGCQRYAKTWIIGFGRSDSVEMVRDE